MKSELGTQSFLQPLNTIFTHFTRISKVWFPLGFAQLQAVSLAFSNRCFTAFVSKESKVFFLHTVPLKLD